MIIYVTLTTPTTDSGPFNLLSNTDGFVAPFAVNVPKQDLINGQVLTCPEGTTIVRLVSVGTCEYFIDVVINAQPLPTIT